MSSKLNFRSDNIDYKELLKKREERRIKQQNNKNPFVLSVPQTNQEVYKTLYKFDAKTELDEFSLPLGQESQEQDKKFNETRSPNKSKMGSEYRTGREDGFYDGEESKMEANFDELPQDQIFTYGQLVKDLFNPQKNKKQKTIQKAAFIDNEVWKELMKIRRGEDAISFFAKYGNATPIKFINCVRAEGQTDVFRPYDLETRNKLTENQKNMTLPEYYTISAYGIVHVFTNKGKQTMTGDTSTEVISLSDWMLESTQFNIITNIQFFKNYVKYKIFNIWRSNVHYRQFCKTRKKLIHDGFICKPQFANHLRDINEMMYELKNIRTMNQNMNAHASYEIEQFKIDQKNTCQIALGGYENIIEKVIQQCEVVCKHVIDKTKIKDQAEMEEGRFGQQQKQKPMNKIRKENEEKAYLLDRAIKDKEKLKMFIRLVDYIVEESLYATNFLSMKILLDQMDKTGRKAGMFTTCVQFDKVGINWSPPEEDIQSGLTSILDEMIDYLRKTTRVIGKMDAYVKQLNTDQICDLGKMIYDSVRFQEIKKHISDKVQSDFSLAQEHVRVNYEKCRNIHEYFVQETKVNLINEDTKVDTIRTKIQELNQWAVNIQEYIKDTTMGVLQVDGRLIKQSLPQKVTVKLDEIQTELLALFRKKTIQTKDELSKYNANLDKKPNTLKEYAEYIEQYNQIEEATKDNKMELRKQELEEMHHELKQKLDSTQAFNANDQLFLKQIVKNYDELIVQKEEANKEIKNKRNDMVQKTEQEIDSLKQKINQAASSVNSGALTDENTNPAEALQKLNDIQIKQIEKYQKQDQTFAKYQKLMDYTVTPNKQLEELQAKFEDRKMIWEHTQKFNECYDEWYTGNFKVLESEVIEKQMLEFDKGVNVLQMRIENLNKDGKDRVLDRQESRIMEIKKVMPVIQALGNRNLKEKHWKKIFEKLGDTSWTPGQHFTLNSLIDINVQDKIEDMEEISAKASGEADIEQSIEAIKKQWSELNFIVKPYREYKDKFIIGSIEDITTALDDHQLKVQTMLGVRFVADIYDMVDGWRQKLILIQEIMDEWLQCQRSWMYLEFIFGAEDIQKQLPQETQKFQQVDKFWRETMLKTYKRPLVQDCCASEELLKKFRHNNAVLDDIQKCLENYLETKRMAFPRFYFLSNDELLEILQRTRDPHAVQSHLRKCFDNINRIAFTEEEESKEIIAMISAEPEIMPETVKFSQPVIAEGPVEHWLFKIQEMMVQSLSDHSKRCLVEYPENGLERRDWLFNDFPAQSILVIDQIRWTEGQTNAIVKQNSGDKKALKEFWDFMIKIIQGSVSIVQSDLNTLQRSLMGALIVLDVHSRDVSGQLYKENIMSTNDFEWSKQLRYYYEDEIQDIMARQTNTYFQYAYEYLGNGPRLVITPLTDKCYITLTGAKHLQYGGAPAGPAGTGKTETTKDLAKALAVQCVVFNCSDGLDYKTMGRFFSGLSQGGAWACFDEFNRIDIEVLSVIAQQILTIQNAIRAQLETFEFEGRNIQCNSRFGVFITMNPGYAGRTELPDNLKALFRPVAMMIPDYGMIAEIILFSEGFETASKLSRKMVNLYKLSSEQLSKQDHYDFGMRAVKSVLVMAGALRRKDPTVSEDIVLIRAMRDSNVPKFLQQDLPLFRGIIQDLFPGAVIPDQPQGNLGKAIDNQLNKLQYQKPKEFYTKIIQLIETMQVRHGVMVVGVASTGKSTNIEILSRALTQLHEEGSDDFWHKQVKIRKLNPKAVTMNELFGYTNLMTNEWTDGIAASLIRDNVNEGGDSKKWIVFDGPVDALWIENMNTVLDDNKMLCLNNGQRIKLPVTFEMVFEVNDLAVASPATVSRCGMVYMEPSHLGWEPLVETWAIKFKEQQGNAKYINEMISNITEFLKEKLEWVRKNCKEVIVSVDNNLVESCLGLVSIVFEDLKAEHKLGELNPNDQKELCAMVYIFAFIWSLGANLEDKSRKVFSSEIKQAILKYFNGFPYDFEVFDFWPNFKEKKFSKWDEITPTFSFDKNASFSNILVPTADTTKYKYLMEKLVLNGKNVLITGRTGVGKSVMINEFIYQLPQDKYQFSTLNFSAQTSSHNLQDLFMDKDKFNKLKKDLIGPAPGKRMVVFIDDINMPALEKYGAQPVNELLRQIIDHGGFYDLKKLFFINVKSVSFISSCANPGGGRNNVTPRLFRHFNMIWCPDLSKKSMTDIFTNILRGFLSEKGGNIEKLASPVVKATIEMYNTITRDLLPTPTKSHYTFNLRDISKVFQGCLMVELENLQSKENLINLWIHECTRVFSDRLVDNPDRDWFNNLMLASIQNLKLDVEYSVEQFPLIMFGDYTGKYAAGKKRDYIEIQDPENTLVPIFNEQQRSYNIMSGKQMHLVFFMDAIIHLSKLCRVLRQPKGNALLIGVGGSGRQSLTRLATFVRKYECFSIEITKSYKELQWKEDLKKLLKFCGARDTEQTFLFSDTQIIQESFLEDINNVLNTGEISNLFGMDDYEEILGDLRPIAKEKKMDQGRDNLLKMFTNNVKKNLHIVLAFSPIGEKLRNRCRMFPSLVNCCAIDWFDKWPEEALFSVAKKQYMDYAEKLQITDYVDKLARLSMVIHADVQAKSDDFYEELRRKNYVTPTSYLELMKLYVEMMQYQQNHLPLKIKKYTVGLETLKATNADVAIKQQQINDMQPQLEKSAKETAAVVETLEVKKKEASETEAIQQKEASEAQLVKDDVDQQKQTCQQELSEAMPAVEKANKQVQNINPSHLQELKSFSNPPDLVKVVLEAVCLLLGEKQDWATAQKQLGKMDFKAELIAFVKTIDQVPERVWSKFRKQFLSREDFNEKTVESKSKASVALLNWAVAGEKFYRVKKEIAPKEKKLKEAEAKYAIVSKQLQEKVEALQIIQDQVAEYQKEYDQKMQKKMTLEENLRVAKEQLIRAEKLVTLLAGESVRWDISAESLGQDKTNLTGNIILAAASLAYLGPFNYQYRQKMLEKWVKDCKEAEIPVAQNFVLSRILAEDVQIREWQESGLPADNLSTDNAIYIFNARRWPLIIDPQGQANKWLKTLKADSNLQVTKLSEPNFLRVLENSIKFGSPVILENVEEVLDPALEPILLKQTVKKGGQLVLQLGDQDITYSQEFRFYMTTKLPNPHYIPEISIKTTIINFTVTPSGLEDQLLVEVIRQEKVELEEKRIQLIIEISQSKKSLQDLEDKILRQIGEAQGRILEDEELVGTLENSKITSENINKRLEVSKVTQEEINTTREKYRVVAKRGSILYFVIAGLSNIDPMYQYSLEFFITLFKMRLERSEKSEDLKKRLAILIEDLTKNFYKNICRGLFEKDKLLYSFLIAINIKQAERAINAKEWVFFQKGPSGEPSFEEGELENRPSYFTEKMYTNLIALSSEGIKYNVIEEVVKDKTLEDQWTNILEHKDPWNQPLPGILQDKLEGFSKLVFLKQVREEKLILMIKHFVSHTLGTMFIEPPPFNLADAFEDSTRTTPLIFVLSAGADPMVYLQTLAKEKNFDTRFKYLSLGQGQGEKAKEFIKSGRRNGDWVCLQNCHLAVSWMTELERIQEQQNESDINPEFRLWLTSMPTSKFPVPVLQGGIKLTNEPPKGLKANITGTYGDLKDEEYNSCDKPFEFKKLLFSLAFFHAIILERRKFGAIGWNISYDWMNSDFQTCKAQLMMYLNEQPEIPWKTLNYLISEINYGGRVTDDKDVRLITAQLQKYFNPSVMGDNYDFSNTGIYKSAQNLEIEEIKTYVQSFPIEDDPEVFGLHTNANITFQNKTVREFMETLMSGQPRSVTKAGAKPEEIVAQMAQKMEADVPDQISIGEKPINSLQVFRYQEITQYNRLIQVIKSTLHDQQEAIKGKVVMSIQLEAMFNSFLTKQVPLLWESVAYPSLKPLSSWWHDFLLRVQFYKEWVEKDEVSSYWVSAMFFPQGFMTAALQTYARNHNIAIDTLTFRTEVKPYDSTNCQEMPEKGVNIHGLFLEGCRWDREKMCLSESHPKQLFNEVPVVWLDPIVNEEYKPVGYKCPLYKTSTRKGTLSTTGHSTNFVMYLDLKSIIEQEHWVRRGVALLMQLDD